ncbi:hypothetical protein GCM10022252_76180 [Streptosporangium oxazolinicum]|uniref:Lsr2 DNA-binding domain-containing protein n=1 Tax=Streptosporangium oxazolinicum TaxID=909287 RepID=A0ABP8BMB6_9ACTN
MSITHLNGQNRTMPADQARALFLLADGHTVQVAATETGLKVLTVVQAARRQGWTVHPSTGMAFDPASDNKLPVLSDDLAAIARAWTPPKPAPAPAAEGSVDELLADAAACDDRHVQTALSRARDAIDRLRGTYAGVAERRAEEERQAAARESALADVADLEAQLAAARQRVKDTKATTSKSRTSSNVPTDAEVRAWAQENGVECSRIGRVSRTVRAQYEAAHRPVAV